MKSKKAAQARKSPMIRLVGLEAAVAATGLAGPVIATAAPGDLDPSFGDVGRRSDINVPWYASLWSIDVRDDDSVLFGGGGEYTYYNDYIDEFVGMLQPDGAPDPGFVAAVLDRTAVYDTVLQSDGKAVGVGLVAQPDGRRKLLLFRLLPGGALDPEFGLSGRVIISDGGLSREAGYSAVLEPDGRIVVAGERNGNLLVARTLANGTLDGSFGTGGIFIGRQVVGSTVRVARVPAGGYRLVGTFPSGASWDCRVAGLTAAGVLDATFGDGGFAVPTAGDAATSCISLAVQPDGRAVIGGQRSNAQPFLARLLPNGTVDPGFVVNAIADRMHSVSALAMGATGKILVAGTDRSGQSSPVVVRLLADGTLDTLYGRGGAAVVHPKLFRGSARINAIKVVANDGLVVGGNVWPWYSAGTGFAARLLGDTGSGGPGVFTFTEQRVLATEQGARAVLSVRRTGGSAGAVAVTYATQAFPVALGNGGTYSPGELATADDDYHVSTGRLTWADDDAGEREIVVSLNPDSKVERPEWFAVKLEAPEGGAGLGLYGADVEIAGSSYPFGEFTIEASQPFATENGPVYFYVLRNHYAQGAASVTVRVAAGGEATAGADFGNAGLQWKDVVLNWSDGEAGTKQVTVMIAADGTQEPAESFTLELVAPTGGAMLGATTQATMQISASLKSRPAAGPSKNGGGAFGGLGVLLLGLAGALRRWRARSQHEGITKA
jgi:uncharacterized delta-60 repeat protein